MFQLTDSLRTWAASAFARISRHLADKPMIQHLTIIATGGTIDKVYFDDKSTFQIGSPQIGEILELHARALQA